MKKSLIILCMLVLLAAGCENKKESNDTTTNNTSTNATTSTSSTTSETTTTTTKEVGTTTTKKTTTSTKKTTTKGTTACRAKKFDKKYTYVYKTEDECNKAGNQAFLDVSDNVNPEVFVYSCRKIKDECGTEWYGVYFYVYNTKTNKEEEFNY